MLLSDRDIKKALDSKRIVLSPLPDLETALSACSLDLRLASEFEIFDDTSTAMKKVVVEAPNKFVLKPGEFALASTIEWLELPDDLAMRLEGRSSLGRLGIVVHSTAALFHPGWRGNIVLELGNHSHMPVELTPGMRVCSMSFEELSSPAERPYYKNKTSKYAFQKGTVASRIANDK
ncbi:MAG: dCTP deaminase [Patescibacteria group bacterium]|jgi:dCTP deaminase